MKVFFEKEDWSITEVDPKHWWSAWSTIHHKCGKHWWAKEPYDQTLLPMTIAKTHKCTFCNEDIPQEIEGLWTMHNWDNIQEQSQFYTSGSDNVFIGRQAGAHTTGSSNVYIGKSAGKEVS